MPSARSAAATSRTRTRTPSTAGARRLSGPRRLVRRPPQARVRWDRVGRLALLVVLGIVAGLYVQHAMAYLAVRSQLQSQSATVSRLERSNAALERQQRQLNDPAWIILDA